jgi:hypothetical protein
MPAGEYAIESGLVAAAMRERGDDVNRALSGVRDADVAQAVLLGIMANDG